MAEWTMRSYKSPDFLTAARYSGKVGDAFSLNSVRFSPFVLLVKLWRIALPSSGARRWHRPAPSRWLEAEIEQNLIILSGVGLIIKILQAARCGPSFAA